MAVCLQRWLTIVLGLTEAGLTILITATLVYLRDRFNGVTAGLLFTIVLDTAAELRLLIDSWTTLDVSLGTLERLQHVKLSTPQESSEDDDFITIPTTWPQFGHLEIHHLASS